MSIHLTKRVATIGISPTSAAAERARVLKAAGHPVLKLTTGEPDFPTPAHIQDAAISAMRAGETKYTSVGGTPALKSAIRAKFQNENNLTFEDTQIIVSNGAKQSIFNAVLALIEAGAEAIVPTPAWVSYADMIRLAGGVPVTVPCRREENFKLTPERLEAAITPRTRLLFLNSPNNPSGALLTRAELEALGAVLRRHPEIVTVTDDIYEHIRYAPGRYHTLAEVCPEIADRVVTVNGVSKAFSMTGWRIGFAAGPTELISAMTKIQSQSTSNPSSVSQAAARAALEGDRDCVRQQCQAFHRRRDMLIDRISRIAGLEVQPPEGAFYLFISVAGLIGRRMQDGAVLKSESDVVAHLLDAAKIAVVGGAAFGMSPYFRLSFAASDDELTEAADRLDAFVNALAARC